VRIARSAGVALVIGASVGTVFALSAPEWEHEKLGEEARRLRIEEPDDFWAREGYVELITPLAPPTRRDGSSRIEVWLRIPDGARITRDATGALVLPPGSEADRVERIRVGEEWIVADVRGARMGEGIRFLRLLRPERAGRGSALLGYEWPDERRDLGRQVHEVLGDLIRSGGGVAREGVDRERFASLLDSRGGCVQCHARRQPDRTHVSQGTPYRATDALGWYSPLAVLRDGAPIERYRPRDLNHEREAVRLSCPDGEAEVARDARGGAFVRCADGGIAWGHLDLRAALAAGEERAQGVCASRRYLLAHMDEATRDAFQASLAPCEEATLESRD